MDWLETNFETEPICDLASSSFHGCSKEFDEFYEHRCYLAISICSDQFLLTIQIIGGFFPAIFHIFMELFWLIWMLHVLNDFLVFLLLGNFFVLSMELHISHIHLNIYETCTWNTRLCRQIQTTWKCGDSDLRISNNEIVQISDF